MGRFKHEGANVIVNRDGHVVAYMGDDERFDYVYRFVSRDTMRPGNSPKARQHNLSLLSEGDLSVARFTGDGLGDGVSDGTGEWIPLTRGGQSMVPGFTIEEVLVYTRLAADVVQPTKMDRPEDVEPSLRSGRIYVACTNNTSRAGDAGRRAQPPPANKDGHVVEMIPTNGDHTADTFSWNLILICGDASSAGRYFGGWTGPVSPISCPDNVAFDSEGNLWVSTDGQPAAIGLNDGLFKVPVEGPERGRVQQFLAVPSGAETCGPVIRDLEGSVFVAVQHPGEDGSYAAPQSRFPDYVPAGGTPAAGQFAGPRPSVVQVTRAADGSPSIAAAWSDRPMTTAAIAGAVAGSIGLLALAIGQGWLGPDVGRGANFCEAARDGFVRQPANTLSNAGFVVAGLLVAVRAGRLPAGGVVSPTVATFFACIVTLLGPGSAAMHATQSEWGGHLDMLSMYLVAELRRGLGVDPLDPPRHRRRSSRRTSPGSPRASSSASGPTRCRWSTTPATWRSACSWSPPWCSRCSSGVAASRRGRVTYGVVALAAMLVAFTIWLLSNAGWCDPTSLLQGHAAWHLLCAVAAYFLFRFYESERLTPRS